MSINTRLSRVPGCQWMDGQAGRRGQGSQKRPVHLTTTNRQVVGCRPLLLTQHKCAFLTSVERCRPCCFGTTGLGCEARARASTNLPCHFFLQFNTKHVKVCNYPSPDVWRARTEGLKTVRCLQHKGGEGVLWRRRRAREGSYWYPLS